MKQGPGPSGVLMRSEIEIPARRTYREQVLNCYAVKTLGSLRRMYDPPRICKRASSSEGAARLSAKMYLPYWWNLHAWWP